MIVRAFMHCVTLTKMFQLCQFRISDTLSDTQEKSIRENDIVMTQVEFQLQNAFLFSNCVCAVDRELHCRFQRPAFAAYQKSLASYVRIIAGVMHFA